MTPLNLLNIVLPELKKIQGHFAIAGGLAASFYRTRPRLTNDIDIAIDLGNIEKSKKTASKIIKTIGYKESTGWISGEHPLLKSPIALILGRPNDNEYESTVDFLLPTFPWLTKAIKRAQANILNFGVAELPAITLEDIIIAKTFALNLEPNRFQDLDDIQSIFKAKNEIDIPYLVNGFENLLLKIPKQLENVFPAVILKASKKLA